MKNDAQREGDCKNIIPDRDWRRVATRLYMGILRRCSLLTQAG